MLSDLGRHGNVVRMVALCDSVAAIVPVLRRQEQALLEQIACGTATQLALQPREAVDVAFDRAITPGQGHASLNGVIVLAQAFRNPRQGHEGTLRRPGQPGIPLVRLALAHEPRNVLG
jgi:hypothetical protein